MGDQPPLEASVEIWAPPEHVWRFVSDFGSMSRASPELVGTWPLGGAPKVGRWCVNVNRRGWFVWPTLSRITRWKPPSNDDGRGALAFHIWPTDVEWSYELEPLDHGTRLTERRTALIDPRLVVRLTARLFLGGSDQHDVELLAGMHRTIGSHKHGAEM